MADLTVHEAAKVLNVHADTVRRLARARKLAGYSIGGRWRFTPEALDRFREESAPAPLQAPALRIARSPRRACRLPGWDKFR